MKKLKQNPETGRGKRGGQDNAARMQLTINHGKAILAFRQHTDLQLTEITARLATIERLLAAQNKETV
jgi:hypothetical protein